MPAPWAKEETRRRADAAIEALGERGVTLYELRRRHVIAVLAACGGCMTVAACVLGIRRQSLQRIVKRLDIPRGSSYG
jgi:transcriptional regulator of acetoin/glycerol metabolism